MLKLYKFLKPYTIPIIASIILVFLQSISELYLPTLMSDIINIGVINGDINYIVKQGGLMLLINIGSAVCALIGGYLAAQIAMGLGKIIRDKIFIHISTFSLNEIDHFGTPSLITRNTNDITQIQNVTFIVLRMMIMAPSMCIGAIIMAISKDPGLSWVIIGIIPLLSIIILIVAFKGFPLFQIIQSKIDKINLILRENLTGIRVIRAFNRVEKETTRFHIANLDLMKTSLLVNRIMSVLLPIMMLIMNITNISIIWFGSIRIEHNDTNIGDMMAFLQYAMQVMFSIIMATMMFIMIPRAQASALRINEVLGLNPEIKDKEGIDLVNLDKRNGSLEFKNVTFSYHGAEEPALRNISFTSYPGEVTAIIGSTGSGKSTLINLIPRFYDINSGRIEINGIDIREIPLDTLRSRIGLIPQKALLFSGTISDNIRYGKEDASEEEIAHAAKISQSTEFINNIKEGFNTIISQGGINVSGGQKQRLSIARALVSKPEIYLFDDSFSALDFKTDAKLRTALKKETLESIVLIVGQRVATIMDADRIIVLDEGQIAGIGRHKELLQSCEVYREIVYSQLSEEEIA